MWFLRGTEACHNLTGLRHQLFCAAGTTNGFQQKCFSYQICHIDIVTKYIIITIVKL
jgi:hypothetical protein